MSYSILTKMRRCEHHDFTSKPASCPIVHHIFGTMSAAVTAYAQGRESGVGVEVLVGLLAVVYYFLGGTHSDAGALITRRVDERQASIRLRSQALVAGS